MCSILTVSDKPTDPAGCGTRRSRWLQYWFNVSHCAVSHESIAAAIATAAW